LTKAKKSVNESVTVENVLLQKYTKGIYHIFTAMTARDDKANHGSENTP